ncbi:hypothetical protein TIFTF001_014349 [Ficus carica]|uniref:Uncharacterized protein n=1 Tax=Ficus carica TaxID=3494 RepID=A0AA88A2L5_FICCA|nr:hypothetical protein TIFTF001_014349 [Ficus carica]
MENDGHDVPNDLENQYIPLATSIQSKLDRLCALSSQCCIYRVPDGLRDANPKAHTPKVVSVGPLHHGNESLRAMEEQKQRYLQAYLHRTNKNLLFYIKIIKEKETKLRRCYAEPISFTSDELVEIVLVDAVFIIEVMLRSFEGFEGVDHIFGNPWLFNDVWYDLLLLENQLPFFILDDLFDPEIFAHSSSNGKSLSIVELFYKFLITGTGIEGTNGNLDRIRSSKIEHFVDLLRQAYIPLKPKDTKFRFIPPPSITELHQAGVKFQVGSSKNLFDIVFSKGILEIPKLTLFSNVTEMIFRNLLAFEQCYCKNEYLNEYIVIMCCLVKTAKDMDLLVKYGIVENNLGDNSKGATLINELGDRAIINGYDFYFADVCKELDAYYKVPWNTWKANLKQNHFNTPWAIVSLIAAGFLLILTFIQAVCSIISVT